MSEVMQQQSGAPTHEVSGWVHTVEQAAELLSHHPYAVLIIVVGGIAYYLNRQLQGVRAERDMFLKEMYAAKARGHEFMDERAEHRLEQWERRTAHRAEEA